jgi:hypothetical protein
MAHTYVYKITPRSIIHLGGIPLEVQNDVIVESSTDLLSPEVDYTAPE